MRLQLLLILILTISATAPMAKLSFEDLAIGAELRNYESKRIGNEKVIDWGINVGNSNSDKFKADCVYDNNYRRFQDIYSGAEITISQQEFKNKMAYNKLLGKFGIISELELKQEKRNNIYTTKYEISGFPIGLKYDLFENGNIKALSLNYIAHYNYYERYEPTTMFPAFGESIEVIEKMISRAIHHKLSFVTELSFFDDKLEISAEAVYIFIRPIGVALEEHHQQNRIFTSELQIDYNLNQFITVGLRHAINRDLRRLTSQNLPVTNSEESITFKLHWN